MPVTPVTDTLYALSLSLFIQPPATTPVLDSDSNNPSRLLATNTARPSSLFNPADQHASPEPRPSLGLLLQYGASTYIASTIRAAFLLSVFVRSSCLSRTLSLCSRGPRSHTAPSTATTDSVMPDILSSRYSSAERWVQRSLYIDI